MSTGSRDRIGHTFARRSPPCVHARTDYLLKGGPGGVLSRLRCMDCGVVLHQMAKVNTAEERWLWQARNRRTV